MYQFLLGLSPRYSFIKNQVISANASLVKPSSTPDYDLGNIHLVIIRPPAKEHETFIKNFPKFLLPSQTTIIQKSGGLSEFSETYLELNKIDQLYILFADLESIEYFNRYFTEEASREKAKNIGTDVSNKKHLPLLISYTSTDHPISFHEAAALLYNNRLSFLLTDLPDFPRKNVNTLFNAVLTNSNNTIRLTSENNPALAEEIWRLVLSNYSVLTRRVRPGLYEIDEATVLPLSTYRHQSPDIRTEFSSFLGESITHSGKNIRRDSWLVPQSTTEFTNITIYRAPKQPAKTILYIPGDGFIRSINMDGVIAASLCEKTNCNVVMINSRLAPEYPFPHPLNDIVNTIIFILTHYRLLNLNVENMAGFGYSSGSTCWLQLSGLIVLSKLNITDLFLFSPQIAFGKDFPPQEAFSSEPYFNKGFIVPLANDYLRHVHNTSLLDHPNISPVSRNAGEILSNPVIFTATNDYNKPSLTKFCRELGIELISIDGAKGGHLALWADSAVIESMASLIIERGVTAVNQHVVASKL